MPKETEQKNKTVQKHKQVAVYIIIQTVMRGPNGVSADQPPQGPNGTILSQPRPHTSDKTVMVLVTSSTTISGESG